METDEQYEKEIQEKINQIKGKFTLIKVKNRDPANLDIKNYIWIIFSANIVYKIDDLMELLKIHRNKTIRLKSSLYILARSILEDLFYLRYFFANYKLHDIEKRFDEFRAAELNKLKKNLKSFIELNKRGKFHFNINDGLTEENINFKINEYESDIDNIRNKFTDIKQKITVENVCKEYDKIRNINLVEPGKEMLSLEYLYRYIYSFKSLYAHQSLNVKEFIFDIIWKKQSYKGDNDEVKSLIINILDSVLDNYNHIKNS